jgi:hypothetical protein
MGTKKPVVELIPSTKLDGIENSLVEIANAEHNFLAELKPKAEAILVNSPGSFLDAGNLLKEIRATKKTGDESMKKWKDLLKRGQDYIKNKVTLFETAITPTENALELKMTNYQREERIAKELEQKRLNDAKAKEQREAAEAKRKADLAEAEERRKEKIAEIKREMKAGRIGKREGAKLLKETGDLAEAEKLQAEADAEAAANAPVQKVEVLSNVPAVAGLQRRVNFKFVITNPNYIPHEYLMPNEVLIGQMVRGMRAQMPKNATLEEVKAAAEKKCAGILVSWEDSI